MCAATHRPDNQLVVVLGSGGNVLRLPRANLCVMQDKGARCHEVCHTIIIYKVRLEVTQAVAGASAEAPMYDRLFITLGMILLDVTPCRILIDR